MDQMKTRCPILPLVPKREIFKLNLEMMVIISNRSNGVLLQMCCLYNVDNFLNLVPFVSELKNQSELSRITSPDGTLPKINPMPSCIIRDIFRLIVIHIML
jgi:hypothetical protein